ncbi:hypothetical protein KORDIASMS9_00133 [Kordia sp. SMS9]|uniref:hypothetical protein n=1 Tax=Kordia sp. SMS9 TaxID=2282170 RepID=UPI000E0D196A|nr:hypothetical protein [Kordia sp. SMS9]AXG67951.1 hypothetical protein KORDIASMS9_00133 [Kordia sp. SMS9]
MNFNIISYILYIPIIFFITIKVGWILYKSGEVFLCSIFQNDIEMTQNLNKLLLIGYYLINLGAATITITFWDTVENLPEMINTLSKILGSTIVLLALLHYNNIFWITFLNRKKQPIN